MLKLKSRIILLGTITVLCLLLVMWNDELAVKQMGLLGYKYDVIKILLHSVIAYKAAKYVIKRFHLERKFELYSPIKIFMLVFLLLNSYIIIQYTTKLLSNKIVKKEIRSQINDKTVKLEYAGCGYQSDSLSYPQFIELTKGTNLPSIPKEAKEIFVYDWYEIDFRREIRFSLDKEFDLDEFYNSDSSILNKISKLEFEYNNQTRQRKVIDTSAVTRYEWSVGSS